MSNIDTSRIKYVAYARKSTDTEDKQVNSIEDQLAEIERMSVGLNIVKTITESGSAKKLGRPGFAELMRLVEDGKVQGIVCWKFNRLARNFEEGGTLLQRIRDGRVKHLRTSDGNVFHGEELVMSGLHLGMADQFSLNLSKDVTRGMLSKARKGLRPGSAPLGYLNSGYRKKGEEEILVDPDRAPIIQKMIGCMLAGTHNAPQALKLGTEDWGLRTRPTKKAPRGMKLTNSAWYNILQNPFYYGWFEYPIGPKDENGIRPTEWIKGKHTPLISFEEFKTIQRLLGKSSSKRINHTFAYIGLMRCGGCGARITCEKKTKTQLNGNVHEYSYYRCTGQVDRNCKQKSVREDRLEEVILNFLSSIEISPEFHTWALEELRKEYDKEKSDSTTILHSHQRKFDETTLMLKNLLTTHLQGHIDGPTYSEHKKVYEKELDQLRPYLESVEKTVANWIHDAERLLTFAERAREEFQNGDLEKKRSILAALGTEHILEQGVLTFQVEKPIEVLRNDGKVVPGDFKPLEPLKDEEEYTQKGTFVPSSEVRWFSVFYIRTSILESRPTHFLRCVDSWGKKVISL